MKILHVTISQHKRDGITVVARVAYAMRAGMAINALRADNATPLSNPNVKMDVN